MAAGTQTPAVSVVVLAYNHAPYIRSALKSVLRQETSFPMEVLIGEDDSQDGTREICKEIKEQHPHTVRLFLRRREDVIYINGRPTGRFNYVTTMKAARGRYIAYLDGDDKWLSPHKLQRQFDLMEAHHEYTLCFHPVVRTYVDSEKSDDTFYPPGREGPYGLGELLQQNVIQSCSVMYRQGYFTCIPNFILHTTVADWPAHIWHLIHGKGGYIDETMGLYRVHDAGAGRHYRTPEASALSALSVLDAVGPHIPRLHHRSLAAAKARRHMELLNLAYARGDLAAARAHLNSLSIPLSPLPLRDRKYLLGMWLRVHYPRLAALMLSFQRLLKKP